VGEAVMLCLLRALAFAAKNQCPPPQSPQRLLFVEYSPFPPVLILFDHPIGGRGIVNQTSGVTATTSPSRPGERRDPYAEDFVLERDEIRLGRDDGPFFLLVPRTQTQHECCELGPILLCMGVVFAILCPGPAVHRP